MLELGTWVKVPWIETALSRSMTTNRCGNKKVLS